MSRPVKEPVSSFSPYYGCFIMAAAALIFTGIIAWSIYTLLQQDRQIDAFTVSTPADFPPAALSEAEEKAFTEKLAALQKALSAGQPASLELTLAEINALVARAPDLGHGTYQGLVRFTGTDPEHNRLLADISLPINPLPFSGKPMRYLVGKAVYQVEVGEAGPDARIVDIEAPGKTIPQGFIESQQTWTWVAPYHEKEELAGALKKLRSARVTPGGLALSTQPE